MNIDERDFKSTPDGYWEVIMTNSMTNKQFTTRLREIHGKYLTEFCQALKDADANPMSQFAVELARTLFDEAEAAICELFNEVVGPDEALPENILDFGDDDQRKYWYNRLRRELRTIIKEEKK